MNEEQKDYAPGAWREEKRLQKRIARRAGFPTVDVSFLRDLDRLALAVSNLVGREGSRVFPNSPIPTDVSVTLTHLTYTFNLLRFVNSDEKRENDPAYRQAYSFVILPVVRTMIDGFYNVTRFFDDPSSAAPFRLAGYRRMLDALDADTQRHGSDPKWTDWLTLRREQLMTGLQADGFTLDDLASKPEWLLLGRYVQSKPDTPYKVFMRTFSLGDWREYSEISHASFRGLSELFMYLNVDKAPHELRDKVFDRGELDIGLHVSRAATLLLALVTETQAQFKFSGHEINRRIREIWRNMLIFPEAKELYENRYERLIQQSGMLKD